MYSIYAQVITSTQRSLQNLRGRSFGFKSIVAFAYDWTFLCGCMNAGRNVMPNWNLITIPRLRYTSVKCICTFSTGCQSNAPDAWVSVSRNSNRRSTTFPHEFCVNFGGGFVAFYCLPPPRLCVRECGVDISRFDSVDASAYNSAIELASSHFYYSYAESWWSLPANTHISSIRLVALSVNAFRTSVIILLAEIARKYAVWFDENIICIHTLPDCFYFLLVARMQIPCISVQ